MRTCVRTYVRTTYVHTYVRTYVRTYVVRPSVRPSVRTYVRTYLEKAGRFFSARFRTKILSCKKVYLQKFGTHASLIGMFPEHSNRKGNALPSAAAISIFVVRFSNAYLTKKKLYGSQLSLRAFCKTMPIPTKSF